MMIGASLSFCKHCWRNTVFGAPSCDQVEIEEWTIAGKRRRVTLGSMGVQSWSAEPFTPPRHWFPAIEAAIKDADLPPGTHWFRCYYGQVDHKPAAIEALLDNEHWLPIIETMTKFDWPTHSHFYSVRVFGVIQDAEP